VKRARAGQVLSVPGGAVRGPRCAARGLARRAPGGVRGAGGVRAARAAADRPPGRARAVEAQAVPAAIPACHLNLSRNISFNVYLWETDCGTLHVPVESYSVSTLTRV